MKAIGIDIGTTSICGVVIDTAARKLIKSITKDSNAFINTQNDWEKIQSVEKIIPLATELLDSLITEDTAVIGVTGQMHGIVYVNNDGISVSPLYTWQDGRGNLPYKNTTYAEHLGSSTGYGNVTDFYNKQNGLVPEDATNFCTIHDYLIMRLCGLKKPLIHISDAASFGLFDIKTKKFTGENNIDFVEDYKIAGSYKNIPVSVAIGDNQASVLSTLSNTNDLLINVGTGSQVSVVSDKIISATGIETRPFFDGKYLAVGAALCGGRAYAMLKNFYKTVFSQVADLDDQAVYGIMNGFLQTEGEPLSVDTRFAGTRSDNSIRGSINGISTENFTPASLTKGVLAGMVCELYDLYKSMGVQISGITGSGNGIRKNKALISLTEDVFGYRMKIPAYTEEAAFGAALYGSVAIESNKNIKNT